MQNLLLDVGNLIDPSHNPSYFQAPTLYTLAGDPVQWEIAVLIVFACSLVALLRLSRVTAVAFSTYFLVSVAPLFVGLAGTAYLVHKFLQTPGLGPDFWRFLHASLFPVHIGFFCGVVLAAAACASAWRSHAKHLTMRWS
jgi:hypothetical protein